MPQLSIVIPVYNNWWLTARCLRSLADLRDRSIPFETIVVDNGSRDETPQAIDGFPWVRYLRYETNRNFAGGCNAGARAAQAPLTLLLNNDAYPLGDALTPLVAAFDRPQVVIAGAALLFEDGVTQAAGLAVLPNAHWHYYCRNLPPALAEVNRSRNAIGISGAAMVVRTAWFLENGGFDETFVNGFEDVDLCLRAREQGAELVYVADARVAHYEAASAGRFAHERANERRFYTRWESTMAQLPRTARGAVGAIVFDRRADGDALLAAARSDLEDALRAFGHPVVRGGVAPWHLYDRRFRRAPRVAWFSQLAPHTGVEIKRTAASLPTIRTGGAVEFEVAFLPCAAAERADRLGVQRSDDPSCTRLGVVGGELEGAISITPQMLLSRDRREFAAVVHLGLTDEAAFGNVLLAQAGLPAVVLARNELRALFAQDVALICERSDIRVAATQFIADPALRAQYGRLVAADARRRFSPRRSAIRVVDMLCAARFGPERAATARANRPY